MAQIESLVSPGKPVDGRIQGAPRSPAPTPISCGFLDALQDLKLSTAPDDFLAWLPNMPLFWFPQLRLWSHFRPWSQDASRDRHLQVPPSLTSHQSGTKSHQLPFLIISQL